MRGSTYTEEEELEKGRAKQIEERNVKFRGWDQSGIHFAYIEDYFYRVAYIKDQNNSTSIHEGPFSSFSHSGYKVENCKQKQVWTKGILLYCMEHLVQQVSAVCSVMPCKLDWCQLKPNGWAIWSIKDEDELQYQQTICDSVVNIKLFLIL